MSEPRVAAVIPWRGGDEWREKHHTRIRAHLEQLLPDAVHLDADDGAQPFSRAGSRNYGVRLAEQHGCDVVVLCDADTLVEAEPLHAAITSASDGVMHLAYTRYRALTSYGLDLHDRLGMVVTQCETSHDHEWSTGGVIVMTPQAWWKAGGMDERFISHGYEDTAYRTAADCLLGETVRHEGYITHLWHPTTDADMKLPSHIANAARMELYADAGRDPAAMRALVKGSHPYKPEARRGRSQRSATQGAS